MAFYELTVRYEHPVNRTDISVLEAESDADMIEYVESTGFLTKHISLKPFFVRVAKIKQFAQINPGGGIASPKNSETIYRNNYDHGRPDD